jgi:hypothetical protein
LSETSTPEQALDAIEKRVVDIHACEYYLAGPEEWIDRMRAALRARGMDHNKWQMAAIFHHLKAT